MKKWLSVVLSLAVLGGATVFVLDRRAAEQRKKDRAAAYAVAVRFLEDWSAKRYADMGTRTASDPDAGESFRNLESRLKATKVAITHGALSEDGRHVAFHVAAVLSGLGPLEWDNQLEVEKTRRGMRVLFRSSTVYPGLQNGQILTRSRPLTSRGELVDRHGTPIRAASADLAARAASEPSPRPGRW